MDDSVIVEVKAVERLEPIHKAQLISYLKLSECKVGLLINFNVRILKSGIRRLVNDFPDSNSGIHGKKIMNSLLGLSVLCGK